MKRIKKGLSALKGVPPLMLDIVKVIVREAKPDEIQVSKNSVTIRYKKEF